MTPMQPESWAFEPFEKGALLTLRFGTPDGGVAPVIVPVYFDDPEQLSDFVSEGAQALDDALREKTK